MPALPRALCVGHAGAGAGRSSTCESRDKRPSLVWNNGCHSAVGGWPSGLPTSDRFWTGPLHPRPNGWTTKPPIHEWRVPSSKRQRGTYPWKYQLADSVSLDGASPSAPPPPLVSPHVGHPPPPAQNSARTRHLSPAHFLSLYGRHPQKRADGAISCSHLILRQIPPQINGSGPFGCCGRWGPAVPRSTPHERSGGPEGDMFVAKA